MFVSIQEIQNWLQTGASDELVIEAWGKGEESLHALFAENGLDFVTEAKRLRAIGKIQRLEAYQKAVAKGNPAAVTAWMRVDFPEDNSAPDEIMQPVTEFHFNVIANERKRKDDTPAAKPAKRNTKTTG